jgi:hypothetical protein
MSGLVQALERIIGDLSSTVGHLVAMKLLSRDDDHRPQDIIDLHALIGVASDGDLEVAASAVQEIESRGFARGRYLEAALQDAVRRFRH